MISVLFLCAAAKGLDGGDEDSPETPPPSPEAIAEGALLASVGRDVGASGTCKQIAPVATWPTYARRASIIPHLGAVIIGDSR
jgi:hypothetical protein